MRFGMPGTRETHAEAGVHVGGRSFENDDWRVRPWSEIENAARPT